jgi:hypothetical protein
LRTQTAASTHKKVVVELLDRSSLRGYLNPSRLIGAETIDLLTGEGEHLQTALVKVRAVYFVRDLEDSFAPERTAFLSRPKLDGLWVKLRFLDGKTLEGVIPNDLLSLLDNGVHLTPPDFNSNADRIFVPRTAITELSVLGVVGIARRKPAAGVVQPRLFNE